MTTTANNLRAALKQSGLNARMVTVKERHCTLCVTIRDASVSLTKVKAIVEPFERVSRDRMEVARLTVVENPVLDEHILVLYQPPQLLVNRKHIHHDDGV